MRQRESAIERLLIELIHARDSAVLTTQPSHNDPSFDLERGYEVGRFLHEKLVQRGYQPVGRKIGFTNPAMWEQFRVSEPIWAYMYDRTVHYAQGEFAHLPLEGMVAPRLEPEIVVKLRCSVPKGTISPRQIARCLEWVAIGYEIVDSHFHDWRFTAADAVADFGVHAALVVGTPWRMDSEEPESIVQVLRELKVRLRGGKDFVAEGEGKNALGSPLLSLAFLSRVLSTQSWAPPLKAGEVITTGTLTSLPYLRSGESYRMEVSGAPLAPLQLDLS